MLVSMKARQRKIKKIAVALRLSYASHRDILYGLSQYAKKHHWSVRIVPIPELFDSNMLTRLEREGCDGFITSDLGSEDTIGFFLRSRTPLVVIGPQDSTLAKRKRSIAFVTLDDFAIGVYAAKFLMSLGKFRTVGFLPSHIRNHCSILRQKGFSSACAHAGIPATAFDFATATDGSAEDISALGKWLESMPKPAAIMAVHDFRATNLLDAARQTKIRIPANLVVLGVDNDELLCDFTEPPLSSIAPDYVEFGTLAAQTLRKLLRVPDQMTATASSWHIVERESTTHITPSAQLVNNALEYINKHALKGISANDVVQHLKTSRRLADLRFKDATGMSILEKIISIRIAAVKAKLRISRAPIKKITAACGFASENYAKNLFKRKLGMSMREYRLRYNRTT